MDDMREIVTVEQVNAAFLALAVLGPVLGAVVGAVIGRRGGRAVTHTVAGLLVGSLGVLNYGLWRLYLRISDRLGMDTVRNLLANLLLFVVLGAVGGSLYGLWARRFSAVTDRRGGEPAGKEAARK